MYEELKRLGGGRSQGKHILLSSCMTSITQLIRRKRDAGEHTAGEIQWIVDGAASGSIADYHLSAWLMAVFFRGMTPRETSLLTRAMCASGERLDLSAVSRPKVDKHS